MGKYAISEGANGFWVTSPGLPARGAFRSKVEANSAILSLEEADAIDDKMKALSVPKQVEDIAAISKRLAESHQDVAKLDSEISSYRNKILKPAEQLMNKTKEKRDAGGNWLSNAWNRFYLGGDFTID